MIILTADDERMARINIISMLEELKLDSLEIIEASNGEDFLKKTEACKPDIAFVDIKMPKLNGLDAIDYAKTVSPNTHYVIVTGFSEFEFAKRAIELKVDSYLLKPVDPEDIKKIIKYFNDKSKTRQNELNRLFERQIIAKYYNVENINSEICPDLFSLPGFQCRSIIFILDSIDNDLIREIKSQLFIKIRDLREAYISGEIMIAVFNIADNIFTSLCLFKGNNEKSVSDYFIRCENTAENKRKNVSTAIIKKNFESTDIKKEYSELIDIADLRIIFGSSFRKNFSWYKNHKDRDLLLEICSSVKTLCSFYSRKKYVNFINIIDKMRKDDFFRSLIKNRMYQNNISNYINTYTGFKTEKDFQESEIWLNQLADFGNTILDKKSSSKKYIDDVIDYIEKNYMKDIGINTIANDLQITPNYLSSIFHREMKMKFTDYISKIRISRAKKLLLETNMTIREISKKVGYQSTRHFTKLFVKHTEIYPSSYRKNTDL